MIAGKERRTVTMVLIFSLGMAGALGVAWLQLRSANAAIGADMEQVETVLASFRESEAGASLSERLTQAQRDQARLQAEWAQLSSRVDSFTGDTPWPLRDPGATVEGRIDFKVALFNARTNLLELARQNHRVVPPDIGMQETIDADEPAETRLWQLATVVRLLEGAIELGIPAIKDIEPLTPIALVAQGDSEPLGREFPVRVAMECAYPGLLKSLDAMLDAQASIGLRRIYVRKPRPDVGEMLRVQLVYTAALLGMPEPVAEPELEGEPLDPLPAVPEPATIRTGSLLP